MPLLDHLPHGASVRLLDAVSDVTPQNLVATSTRHQRHDHPYAQNGSIAGVYLLELAAQAAGVHWASTGRGTGARPSGVLAYVRELSVSVPALSTADPPLKIEVHLKTHLAGTILYTFTICFGGLAAGSETQNGITPETPALAQGEFALAVGANPFPRSTTGS